MQRIVTALGALAALGVALGVAAVPARAQSSAVDTSAAGLRGSVEVTGSSPGLRGEILPSRAVETEGAGETGFVSGNGVATEDVLPQTEQPLDRLDLPDSSLSLPPRTTRRRPATEDDPFAPVGVRVGSFIVKPFAELRGGYDSNALRVPGGKGSLFSDVGGGFAARSDWSRHALDVELRGGYTSYADVTGNNRPDATAIIRGRLDINSLIRLDAIVRGAITTDSAGSVDEVGDAREPPLIYETGVDIGLTRRFNRLEVSLAGLIEREDHAAAQLDNGQTLSLADRNVTGYGVRLRGAYELMPGVKPFAQVVADRRVYDVVPDSQGYDRDSRGATVSVGTEFRLSELLTGTASIGYTWRDYVDPTLQNINGMVADAALRWEATGLTTVVLTARSGIEETTYANASGDFVHEARVEIEHALRRWLIGNVSVAYRVDDYEGSGLIDRTFTASAGLTYKINRYAVLTGEVSHLRLNSSVPGSDYTANVVQVGLRLQR